VEAKQLNEGIGDTLVSVVDVPKLWERRARNTDAPAFRSATEGRHVFTHFFAKKTGFSQGGYRSFHQKCRNADDSPNEGETAWPANS
jgi:hypothetical protein